jgi:3'-phosphoadenosine 5'-phosphosulfate sulfotransferase (PAPS reductase)/FAD synthetase
MPARKVPEKFARNRKCDPYRYHSREFAWCKSVFSLGAVQDRYKNSLGFAKGWLAAGRRKDEVRNTYVSQPNDRLRAAVVA